MNHRAEADLYMSKIRKPDHIFANNSIINSCSNPDLSNQINKQEVGLPRYRVTSAKRTREDGMYVY